MNHLNDAPKSAPDTKKLLAELDVLAEAGALSADHIQMLALIAQQAAARQTGSPAHVDAPAAAGVVERVQAVAATVSPAPHVAPAPVSAVVEETPEARADRVIASVLSMLGARKGGLYIAGQRPGQGGHSSFFAMNDLAGLNMQDEKSVNTFGKSIVRSSYNRIFDVTQEDLLNTKPYAYMETFVDQYPDPIIVSWAPIDSEVMIALTTGDERFDNRSWNRTHVAMLVSIPLATEMFSVLHDPASAAKLFEILLRKGGESAKHLVGATDGTNPNPATRRANPVKTEVVIPIPFDPNNPFLIRAE